MINKKLQKIRINELELVEELALYHCSSDFQKIIDDSKLRLYSFDEYVEKKDYYFGIESVIKYLIDSGYDLESELILKSGPIMLRQSQIFVTSFYDDFKNKELWLNDCARPQKEFYGEKECCVVLDYKQDLESGLYLRKVITDLDYWFSYFEEVLQLIDGVPLDVLKDFRTDLVGLGLVEDRSFRTYLLLEEIIKSFPWMVSNSENHDEYRAVKIIQKDESAEFNLIKQNYFDLAISGNSPLKYQKVICRRKPAKKNNKTPKIDGQQDLFS